MSTTTPERRGTADLTVGAAEVTQADVTDELERAGVAFGDLIKLTGEAVAETQRQLEITAADTIGALSSTQVEIIAAEVLEYDDSGTLRDSAQPVVQTLPLLTIMDPAVYQWTKVRAQGLFFAREFATDSTSTVSTSSTSASASARAGGLPFFGSARASFQHSRATTETEVETTQDTSFGLMRLNAMLQPREDTGIPKPRQMVVGPSIQVALGPVTVDTPTDPAQPTLRHVTATITYTRQDGAAIAGKTLSIEISEGLSWEYGDNGGADAAAKARTNTDGQVVIRATRTVGPGDTGREAVLSVRMGLVGSDTTLPV